MAKKKITKASKRRLLFFGSIAIGIIFYFCFNLFYYATHIYKQKQEIQVLEQELKNLKQEEKS